MPQIIGVILAIIVIVFIVACIVWILQWIAACIVWPWQVIVEPFFIYFSPAAITIVIAAGLYWGSAVAVKNYFVSLKTNISLSGLMGKFTRYYIISVLTVLLIAVYSTFTVTSGLLVYEAGTLFVAQVHEHYASVKFPAFRIHFPFWD